MAGSNLRGLTNSQVAQRLQELVDRHLFNNPNTILKNKDSIRAFGIYTIRSTDGYYTVYRNRVLQTHLFAAKSALAWCVADKYLLKSLKQRIKNLDHDLGYRKNEIEIMKSAIASVSSDRKYIIEDKLQTSIMRAQRARNQLNKCLNSAKYYQLKGFENETSRLGIKTSSTTVAEGI